MIQKKSLKDAIQNPEIISVVGGLLNNPLQRIPNYIIRGGGYDLGSYIEICTIKKEDVNSFNSVELYIHNSFYGAQHGGFAHLYILISSNIVPKLISSVLNPFNNSLIIYTYFDGNLLHIYVSVKGGNAIGDFGLFIGRAMGQPQITYIGSQMKEIPSEATVLTV